MRDEQGLREKVEIRNTDLRKKLREAKGETRTGKQLGNFSQEEKEGSHQSTDSSFEKLNNGNVSGNEAKPPTAGKTPEKNRTATNSVTVHRSSPIRHTILSDVAATAGNSFSHTPIAQLTSAPVTPKTKGSITNPKLFSSKIDPRQIEKSELNNGSDAASRLNRSRSGVKELEARSRTSTIESSVASSSIKEKSTALHRRNETTSTVPTPQLIPPLRPPRNGPKTSGHKHTQSLHDFDPLKSTVPVISFPTSLSLETLPIKASSTSESMSLPHDLRGTFMSQNPLVVPVTFGMAPTAVRTTEGAIGQHPSPMPERQTLVANGYHGLHQQQFMVVPQQQPIVFNQMTGGMQHQMVENTYPNQQRANTLQSQQFPRGSLQHQHAQHQSLQHHLQHQSHPRHINHPTQQMHLNSGNPFDPFSS